MAAALFFPGGAGRAGVPAEWGVVRRGCAAGRGLGGGVGEGCSRGR